MYRVAFMHLVMKIFPRPIFNQQLGLSAATSKFSPAWDQETSLASGERNSEDSRSRHHDSSTKELAALDLHLPRAGFLAFPQSSWYQSPSGLLVPIATKFFQALVTGSPFPGPSLFTVKSQIPASKHQDKRPSPNSGFLPTHHLPPKPAWVTDADP